MKISVPRLALLALAIAALIPTLAFASSSASDRPAIEIKSNLPGKKVIATPAKLGIYYWDTEKAASGKIKCVGKCAKVWPPVIVTHAVSKHVAGVMATFGTIKRGTKLQLTVNGLPAYTFHGDRAGFVKCDGVDGWHAVRAA